jgi:protein-disulfide isomerase
VARGPLWAALLLGLAGVALSLVLARVHAQAHAGVASFCSISDTVNCDRVATSPYSVALGLPVAVWGALGYAIAAVLAGWGLRRSADAPAAAGLLSVAAAIAVTISLALALVSELAIGALCLLCAGSWLMTVALLLAAVRACRGVGLGACVREGLAALRARPARSAAIGLVGAGALVFAAAAYPRYWERPPPGASLAARPGAAPVAVSATGRDGAGATSLAGPVVVEYSDYECPFCARAHEQTRAILRERPDITVVRRQFPLDASCNPALTRTIHPAACSLARAGICAQEQGRFTEMDDALFRNQREGLSPMVVAERVGLDLDRFRACLTSPATDRRLQSDVAAGIRDGVRATPTYLVGRTARAGEFPLDLIPPAPVSAR